MKEKIEAILKELVAGIDVNSTALVDEGYVTSITMIQLISALDDAFGVEIAYESLTKENLESVDAIAKMVEDARTKA